MPRFGLPDLRAADLQSDDTFIGMTLPEVTGGAPSTEGSARTVGFHTTLDAVARIALHVAGSGEPARVCRRAFAAARKELALEHAVPTTQGLEHRYGRKFADIVRKALTPPPTRGAPSERAAA